VSDTRFAYIFAPALYGRLHWFGRLRWLAAAGLASASLLGPYFGIPAVWPSLFIVAAIVAAYNVVLWKILRLRKQHIHPFINLRVIAVGQTALDLAALMVAVHFTGGLQSPLLPFFAFHMTVGTLMIAARTMYILAGASCLGTGAMYLLESSGVLRFYPINPGETIEPLSAGLSMITLVVTLFGIVYLANSVTKSFKERNVELYRTTDQLRERSAELQKALTEISELEQRKSHYMRISAHQLRSPLSTIKTSLQVLQDGYADPATERGRKLLGGALDRVSELLATVNDLLELAKIREGVLKKAPWSREVMINQVLADLFDSLAPYADEKGVEMTPDFEGVAVLDWGVPPDLVHAFENLIYNAVKYSNPGGEVTVHLRIVGEAAVIRFIDRGIGIPEEFVDQVLLEFVRAPNAKKHATEGTGIGLAIAKEVIEAHGGRIAVASVEGEGTTFTVTMPLHQEPQAQSARYGIPIIEG
jgi:signal transduction histidine kinase